MLAGASPLGANSLCLDSEVVRNCLPPALWPTACYSELLHPANLPGAKRHAAARARVCLSAGAAGRREPEAALGPARSRCGARGRLITCAITAAGVDGPPSRAEPRAASPAPMAGRKGQFRDSAAGHAPRASPCGQSSGQRRWPRAASPAATAPAGRPAGGGRAADAPARRAARRRLPRRYDGTPSVWIRVNN